MIQKVSRSQTQKMTVRSVSKHNHTWSHGRSTKPSLHPLSSKFTFSFQIYSKQPCKYYNQGRCKDGASCSYLHVCKYFLTGSCRYGSNCKLNHSVGGRRSAGATSRTQDQPAASNPQLTDGRPYQWQINDGKGWKDVDNDHIIEAQYSLPHSKSIKIYNTPFGAVNIDFKRMEVCGKKNLTVRRLDDGNTVWVWYCTLNRKWMKYGEKTSKGSQSPVKSADIESKFQRNPNSSYTFTVGGENFEIKFPGDVPSHGFMRRSLYVHSSDWRNRIRYILLHVTHSFFLSLLEMQQVGKTKKRKVTRRPEFRKQQGAAQLAPTLQALSLGSKPQWEFEGNGGTWHHFKLRSGSSTECSVTSDEIERKYQQNPTDSMMFKVQGQTYKLDFRAMTQINQITKRKRKIRRVLV
uniref:Si:ch211-244b2.4 n=1 Tax=Fundulus heteroclitus TaxID=8078 RepID=A0A3Q2NWI1_FUNHE